MANRKAYEQYVIEFMTSLTKGGYNGKVYKDLFARMTDQQMDEFINSLEAGEPYHIWFSNYDKEEGLDWEHILGMCEKYGFNPEHHLILKDHDTGVKIVSPVKWVVGTAEVRKQRQMWVKKFGYTKDDSSTDDLTGQVIGDSRAAGFSAPELGVLVELGLTTTAQELYNVKGGDVDAFKSYKNELLSSGKTTAIGSLRQGSGVKSLKTVQSLLRGRMLDNNVAGR